MPADARVMTLTPEIAAPREDDGARRAALVGVLRELFARVLRAEPVGPDDDFFDLGGDSILALNLMLEIQAATGVTVPVAAIYDHPTAVALADLLAAPAEADPASGTNLVLLRKGGLPALFIVAGVGGTVTEVRELARRIDTDRAIYGVEARGLDGLADPFDRVEDMAAFDIAAMRRVQPAGPFLLAGYSFGGLVALEMAQRLTAAGETVALLMLLDTFPHTRFWPLRCRVAAWRRLAGLYVSPDVWTRMARYHLAALRAMPPAERARYVVARAGRAVTIPLSIFRSGAMLSRFTDHAEPQATPPARPAPALPTPVARVHEAADRALAAYKPATYPGELVFVKAALETRVGFDPRELWRGRARALTIHTVPGDHHGFVTASVGPLADYCAAALRSAMKAAA